MADELKIGGVCLLTGAVVGMMLTLMVMPHPKEQALRDDLRAVQTARTVEAAGDRATTAIGTRAEARVVQIRTVTKEVVRYVPQILTPEIDRKYPVPWGFVRLHDAAITGDFTSLGEPAAEPDDAASDVAASQAAVIVAANYGACSENAARLTALQDWVRAQQAIMNGGKSGDVATK